MDKMPPNLAKLRCRMISKTNNVHVCAYTAGRLYLTARTLRLFIPNRENREPAEIEEYVSPSQPVQERGTPYPASALSLEEIVNNKVMAPCNPVCTEEAGGLGLL